MDDSYDITVTNAPLPYTVDTLLSQLNSGNNLGTQLSTNLCFCFCFVSAFYILFLIKERETRSKLLQFVGGVKIWTFWLSQLLWDILTFALTAVIVICAIACWQEEGYKSFDDLGKWPKCFLLNRNMNSFLFVLFFSSLFPYNNVIWLFCSTIYLFDIVLLYWAGHWFCSYFYY